MKYFKSLIPFAICFIVSCKSPSDKITESFNEVNKSLERTNEKVDSLSQKIKFIGFDEAVADSLTHVLTTTSGLIRGLKKELDSIDGKGDKIDVAETLLINTHKGDSLFNYMMSMYGVGIKYSDSSARQEYILLKSADKDKWLEKYFKRVPTVAARTILSKFQNDLVRIKTTVMAADISELKNKIQSEE